MMDFQTGKPALQHRQNDERSEGGEKVADEIHRDGDLSGGRIVEGAWKQRTTDGNGCSDDRDQHETGMADAGIAQHALEIALGNGGEIAEQQRRHGANAEERNPDGGGGGKIEDAQDHAHQDDESPRLRSHGKKRGDRIRRPFVNIRRPTVKGYHRDLETDASEDHEEAKVHAGRHRLFQEVVVSPEEVEAGGAGETEDVGDAHDEKRGGKRAENEVFDAGFQGDDAAALVGDEDVKGNGDEFQRDEQKHEVVRGGEEHEPGGGEEGQDRKFAPGVSHRGLHVVAHPDYECGHDEEKEVEEFGGHRPSGTCRPKKAWDACQSTKSPVRW